MKLHLNCVLGMLLLASTDVTTQALTADQCWRPSINSDYCNQASLDSNCNCCQGEYRSSYLLFADKVYSCKECASGTYQANFLHYLQTCNDCGAGKYNSETGQSVCDNCAAGKSYELPGAKLNLCGNCEAGKFSAAGAMSCTPEVGGSSGQEDYGLLL